MARLAGARSVAIPVIASGEYRFGLLHSRYCAECERWLSGFLSACRVLEAGVETAAQYARVRLELKRAGTPIPANDAWIAALSRQHGLPILSKDGHFDLVRGIERLNW